MSKFNKILLFLFYLFIYNNNFIAYTFFIFSNLITLYFA